jgi:hypothetical protein
MEKRLQIDFTERAYNELVALQKRLDARSKSEVIRNALGVLQWLTDQVAARNRLIVEKPDGSDKEIVFHFLDHVRPKQLENPATEFAVATTAAERRDRGSNENA